MKFKRLSNGIDLIYIPVKTFYNTVVVGTKAGYSYDPNDEIGLNHLYEHLFVAMLERLYRYSERIEKYGFSQNAFTYNSAMLFYFEQYKDSILKILGLFKKNIEKFMIDQRDFNIEKSSVKNEISNYNKNYENLIFDFVKRKGFTLARNKRVDTQRSINKLDFFSLLREHNNIFSKGNVVVVIYGKISKKEYSKIIDLIESVELPDGYEESHLVAGNYNKFKKRNDTGVILYNIKNPTFEDYLCERIYKNTMVMYDDSMLFNFVRNKNRLAYNVDYGEIDGVGERVFYFAFTFKDKKKLKYVMNEIKNPLKKFKQTKKEFEKGKKRTIIEFYKDSMNQSDFALDLAYYYILYGEALDIHKIINKIKKIKYEDYKKWLRKIKWKKLIV